jgi:hypothetical protein
MAAAAANGTFTVYIYNMSGGLIKVPNMSMRNDVYDLKKSVVDIIRLKEGRNLSAYWDIQLIYMTPRGRFGYIELLEGNLIEYGIDFFDPDIEIRLLENHDGKLRSHQESARDLESILSEPTCLETIPDNVTVVHEVSPDLNFKRIYILKNPGDQKGLSCTVKYISPIISYTNTGEPLIRTIIDLDKPDRPEMRLIYNGGITTNLLYPYVSTGRVLVEEPTHGGRKKHTRRTRRKLHKKRTHRKRRNHKRMLR